MDVINRQKLIDKLSKLQNNYSKIYDEDGVKLANHVIEDVMLEVKKMDNEAPKWISVDSALPETQMNLDNIKRRSTYGARYKCLVYCESGVITKVDRVGVYDRHTDSFRWYWSRHLAVKYWMPMPIEKPDKIKK